MVLLSVKSSKIICVKECIHFHPDWWALSVVALANASCPKSEQCVCLLSFCSHAMKRHCWELWSVLQSRQICGVWQECYLHHKPIDAQQQIFPGAKSMELGSLVSSGNWSGDFGTQCLSVCTSVLHYCVACAQQSFVSKSVPGLRHVSHCRERWTEWTHVKYQWWCGHSRTDCARKACVHSLRVFIWVKQCS